MKCPHCGKHVPTPLDQPPVKIPDTIPKRWANAREFLSLVWSLDGNINDAVLLCLLAEDQLSGLKSSVRDLSARSNGLLSHQALTRLKARVADGQVARVLVFSGEQEEQVSIDLGLVRHLATESVDEVEPAFLWFLEQTNGNFRDALVLSLLLQAGADREGQQLTKRKITELSNGLYTTVREINRALAHLAPLHGEGLVQQLEYRIWAINSKLLNERLAQQAVAWVTKGQLPDPWEAGMNLLLSQPLPVHTVDA
jgi:hypothetical protein